MLNSFIKRSQFYFIGSFAALIGAGTLLLMLPWVREDGVGLDWVDALFTATSATCVTGLTVVDTSTFNPAGQLIILGLIQLGGIGIMSLSASIVLMMGRQMSYAGTLLLSNLNENFSFRGAESLTRTVAAYTLFCEAAGALLLLPGFWLMEGVSTVEALYYAVFHSISAFCNAGFSPFDDSLCRVSGWIKLVTAGLVILGGLGVYVVYDLRQHFQAEGRRLRLHTRLVLVTTLVLLIGGTLLIKCQQMLGTPEQEIGWIDAFFTATSARTAGFNSIDLKVLTPGSVMTLIVLMLIGASPGSTGGGMKTSTVALAAVALYNTFIGNQKVLQCRREIPMANVLKAFVIIVVFILLTVFGTMVLMQFVPATETLQRCFFETSSAISTTGYSLGVSAAAENEGKLLLSLFMFLGRVGPFTFFLFLMGREKVSRLTYPEERVIIG